MQRGRESPKVGTTGSRRVTPRGTLVELGTIARANAARVTGRLAAAIAAGNVGAMRNVAPPCPISHSRTRHALTESASDYGCLSTWLMDVEATAGASKRKSRGACRRPSRDEPQRVPKANCDGHRHRQNRVGNPIEQVADEAAQGHRRNADKRHRPGTGPFEPVGDADLVTAKMARAGSPLDHATTVRATMTTQKEGFRHCWAPGC